jgi:hypothetical protein
MAVYDKVVLAVASNQWFCSPYSQTLGDLAGSVSQLSIWG